MDISFDSLHSESSRHTLFRGVWGSHAFGTSTPESDRDMIGVFILPAAAYLSLEPPPDQVADAHSDIRYYALRNYLQLAANANPNILDSLFLPADCALHTTPYWRMLQEKRAIFVSKAAAKSYGEYALAQIKQAKGCNKRVHNPQPEEPPRAEDFCRFIPPVTDGMPGRPIGLVEAGIALEQCHVAAVEFSSELFRLYRYGPAARGVFRNGTLCCESIPIDEEKAHFTGFLLFNRNAFEQAKVRHRQYWDWRRNRNEARWRNQETGELDYNAKNLMHTFRLLYSGQHIMRCGEPLVRVSGAIREELMAIRSGAFAYAALVEKAERLAEALQDLKAKSPLPEQADLAQADLLLATITRKWEEDHA